MMTSVALWEICSAVCNGDLNYRPASWRTQAWLLWMGVTCRARSFSYREGGCSLSGWTLNRDESVYFTSIERRT